MGLAEISIHLSSSREVRVLRWREKPAMDVFLGQVVNGLMLGGLYALISTAYTLIFGVLRIVYLTHGQVMMIGAYSALFVFTLTRNLFIALAFAALIGALLGVGIERFAVRPLYGEHHLMPLVTTVSIGVILEELTRMTVNGGQMVSYPDSLTNGSPGLRIGFIAVSTIQIAVFAISLVSMLGLTYIIRRTWYGRAMRAMAQNPDVAAMLGVSITGISSMTFALSSAITAAAGVLFGLIYTSFDPYFGGIIGLKALAVCLFGGLGSVPGAVLAGFVLGLTESLAAGYLPTSYQNAFAFGLMMIILLVRPSGLVAAPSRP